MLPSLGRLRKSIEGHGHQSHYLDEGVMCLLFEKSDCADVASCKSSYVRARI